MRFFFFFFFFRLLSSSSHLFSSHFLHLLHFLYFHFGTSTHFLLHIHLVAEHIMQPLNSIAINGNVRQHWQNAVANQTQRVYHFYLCVSLLLCLALFRSGFRFHSTNIPSTGYVAYCLLKTHWTNTVWASIDVTQCYWPQTNQNFQFLLHNFFLPCQKPFITLYIFLAVNHFIIGYFSCCKPFITRYFSCCAPHSTYMMG